MTDRPHVIKFGGSLLSRPDAPRAIAGVLGELPTESHQIVIVGGGEPVEWLRRVDATSPLGDAASHCAAIAMMDANALAVAAWLPGSIVAEDWQTITERSGSPGRTLFRVANFLATEEPALAGVRLPIGWQVTSDSIAARIAALLGARLTLVKSQPFTAPDSIDGWRRLAKEGAVDEFFPRIVGEVDRIKIVAPC